MIKMYYDVDADLKNLKGKRIAIIGYGSQGHAQAQNLKDSGLDVIIGLRKGRSWDQAVKDGFEVLKVKEASNEAHIIQILLPDERQPRVYREEIEPSLKDGDALSFSHGFNIHYNQIYHRKTSTFLWSRQKVRDILCVGSISRVRECRHL